MNKLISTKNRVFISLVDPSETGKAQFIYNWLKIGTFPPKFDKIYFLSTFSTSLRCYAKRSWKSRVCAWSKLWICWFDKKTTVQSTCYFLAIPVKRFAVQRPLSTLPPLGDIGVWTIYIKHNFFHQSKLGRDVGLQNTHIVLFKSPRDVMQVTTLSTQLGLGSEVFDWYRVVTSVPLVICWLICRHAQTIDYVIVQTLDPFPQILIPRTGWNSPNFGTMNTQNLSTLQIFQSFSHKCKNLFFQSCSKEFIRFLCECIINLLKGTLQSLKR